MENSPFAKLPGELRNRIWEYALRSETRCSMRLEQRRNREVTTFVPKFFCDKANKHPLALTQVCRTIRHETFSTFFAINTFSLQCVERRDGRPTAALKEFGSMIGPDYAQALRKVKIHMPPYLPCACSIMRPSICIYCELHYEFLEQLRVSAVASFPKLTVELVYGVTATTFSVTIALEHICKSDLISLRAYLAACGSAFEQGERDGDWELYKKLTGVEAFERTQNAEIRSRGLQEAINLSEVRRVRRQEAKTVGDSGAS